MTEEKFLRLIQNIDLPLWKRQMVTVMEMQEDWRLDDSDQTWKKEKAEEVDGLVEVLGIICDFIEPAVTTADVIEVAKSLGMTATKYDIAYVKTHYDIQSEEDPSGNRELWIEELLYQSKKNQRRMKYIVIDTWNGGGMDDYNGESIKIFSEVGEACKYAKNKARDEVTENRDMEPYVKEYVLQGIKGTMLTSFGYEEEGGNEGTYQVHFLKDDIYAVNIKCNINEVTLLTREEYDDLLDYLHEEVEKKDGFLGDYHDGNKFIDDGQYYNKLIILNKEI